MLLKNDSSTPDALTPGTPFDVGVQLHEVRPRAKG